MAHWPICIDMPLRNILSALSRGIFGPYPDRKPLQQKVESLFGESGHNIACTSVRSGLDLFLSAMAFPKGSEIILTAINIPDMSYIIEHHGLSVVPVDIDLETLCPKEELLELAISDKTVAVLVAHIYGKWMNLDSVASIAKANNLYLLEDCAECFQGFSRQGHKHSDVVFFSFGLIKNYTCFGGAMIIVQEDDVYQKMRSRLESYPVQGHSGFFQKLLKYSFLSCILNSSPVLFPILKPLFYSFGFDYMEYFIGLLRGYPEQMMRQLPFQPSAGLLEMMYERLSQFDPKDFENAQKKGDFVKDRLPDNVFVPGQKADSKNYWLFPLLVDDPPEVMKALEREGIHAYQGATQLRTVYRTQQKANTNPTSTNKTSKRNPFEQKTSSISDTEVAAGNQLHTTEPSLGAISITPMVPHHSFSADGLSQTSISESSEKQPTISKGLSKEGRCAEDILYPYNAEYMIQHVLYLPVHKNVPLAYLKKICKAMDKVMKSRVGVCCKNGQKVFFPSKL
ncbi:uncharacterized protein LOC5514824 [Nematostella vectensis]|uniref:uncharacterized protein LOC5514824 n=1 Tax=Nematostella vectensis TaxID=45351 RepID=UPI002076EF2F|nr:uncharacterized protein LOC5514824 [Nematostella vectensis]